MDESPIAQLVAREFATEHTVLRAEEVGPEALLELLGRLDEPFCDAAFVPTFALSAMTRRYVKVALSGDGGDEVFGGYPKYLWGAARRPPLPFASLVHRGLRALPWRPRGAAHVYWRTLSSQDQMRFSWTCYGDFPVFRKDMRQLLVRPTRMPRRSKRILRLGSDARNAMVRASTRMCLCARTLKRISVRIAS